MLAWEGIYYYYYYCYYYFAVVVVVSMYYLSNKRFLFGINKKAGSSHAIYSQAHMILTIRLLLLPPFVVSFHLV